MKVSRTFFVVLFLLTVGLLCANAYWLWKPRPDQVSGDTLIHLVFARNLVNGLPFEYNIGQPSRALTSLLWNWLLAGVGWLTGTTQDNAHFLTAFRGLSILVLMGALALVYRTARLLSASIAFSMAGIVLLATNPSVFYWMVANPMETSGAALLAVLIVLWAAWATHIPSPARWAAGAALVFAGFLTRPELLALGPLAAMAAFLVIRPLPWKAALVYGSVLGGCLALYAGWFHWAGLSGLPNAGSARRLMLLIEDASPLPLLGIPYSADPFLFVLLFSPLLFGTFWLSLRGDKPEKAAAIASLFMAAFATVFFAFYFYTTWQGRYLLPVIFALVPTGVAGLSLFCGAIASWRVASGASLYTIVVAMLLLRPLSAYANAPAERLGPAPVFVQPSLGDRKILCQEIQSAYFYPGLFHVCTEGLIGLESLEARQRDLTVLEFIHEQHPDLIGVGRYPLRDPEKITSRIASAARAKSDLDLPGVNLIFLGEMAGCGPVFRAEWSPDTPARSKPANP